MLVWPGLVIIALQAVSCWRYGLMGLGAVTVVALGATAWTAYSIKSDLAAQIARWGTACN